MEDINTTAPVADETAVTAPAVEPVAEPVVEKPVEDAPVPADIDFIAVDEADDLTRTLGKELVKTFNDEELLATSLAISFARAIRAVAYNQKAGDPEAFIDLVADIAFEHGDAELEDAAEVCLAEMTARRDAAVKTEG